MLKIYLAGPMRGYPNFNREAFDHAAKKLREQGFTVFSPAEEDVKAFGEVFNPDGCERVAELKGYSRRKAFAVDTEFICKHADIVALLPDWQESEGAVLEFRLARTLGLTTMELGRDYHVQSQTPNW